MARILVVDDDDGLLFLIGEYLGAFGFDFTTASSVAQARHRLKHGRYDLVISDLHMGGESGLDLFRYVSARYPTIRFILMTGCLDSRIKREALKLGVCDYMEKPFQFSDLIEIIRNAPSRQTCAELPATA